MSNTVLRSALPFFRFCFLTHRWAALLLTVLVAGSHLAGLSLNDLFFRRGLLWAMTYFNYMRKLETHNGADLANAVVGLL